MAHSVALSKKASPLNDTARDKIRPSTSGSATFIAISRAESPWILSVHAVSDALDKMTWKTGDLFAARMVNGFRGLSSPSCGEPTAKAVQFKITLGGAD